MIVESLREWSSSGKSSKDRVKCLFPLNRYFSLDSNFPYGPVESCNLIITSGGTGIGPRDVTPEATARCLDKQLPALVFAICSETSKTEPLAFLSRGLAGVVGRTVVINVPGAPNAVSQFLSVGLPLLAHAVSAVGSE